jgi:hypothetical protein
MTVSCSLRLSGPEHVCSFGMEPCFFFISSTKTHLSTMLAFGCLWLLPPSCMCACSLAFFYYLACMH